MRSINPLSHRGSITLNQASTDTIEYVPIWSVLTPILFPRQVERGEKNWANFFGTHLYLYCFGSVVHDFTIGATFFSKANCRTQFSFLF